jgi:hypothetical protein
MLALRISSRSADEPAWIVTAVVQDRNEELQLTWLHAPLAVSDLRQALAA